MKNLAILFILLILNFSICIAKPTKIPKEKQLEYKIEMEKVIEDIINGKNAIGNVSYKDYILNTYDKDYKLYQNFLINKNNIRMNKKYTDELSKDISSFDCFAEIIYNKFLPVINKYSLTIDGSQNTFDYINKYYLSKYKISSYNEYLSFFNLINPFQNKLISMREEIINYSKKYEQTKIDNFYVNIVQKSITVNLDEYLLTNRQSYEFSPKKIYLSKATVFQILNGAVLANDGYNINVLYIQTDLYDTLHYGDQFFPYIPLKFIGISEYINLYGERKRLLKFREVLPNEFKKIAIIPQIHEPLYFIEKPKWINSLETVIVKNQNTFEERIFRKNYR